MLCRNHALVIANAPLGYKLPGGDRKGIVLWGFVQNGCVHCSVALDLQSQLVARLAIGGFVRGWCA